MRARPALLTLLLAAPVLAGAWPPAAPPCPAAASPAAFEAAFRSAAPAVVRVLSLRYRAPGEVDAPDPADPFAPLAQPGRGLVVERSSASGFVVSGDGHVLGSAHAVAGAAQTWVELRDGHQLPARLLGVDPRLDLALLKVEAQGLTAIPVSREDPRPGQWVAALGAPFGFEQSISAGMVSAYPRELPGVAGVGLIQTDVAINPGSSGGPLLNACGQAVGMSVMLFAAHGLYVGVTFAVPARRLAQAAAALLAGAPRGGGTGLRAQSLTPALARAFGAPRDAGALVVQVDAGSAAARAGLRPGDVVLALDGAAVPHADALEDALAAQPPGHPVQLALWRERALRSAVLRLPGAPPPGPAAGGEAAAEPRLGLAFGPHPPGPGRPREGLHVVAADGAGLLAGVEDGDCIAAVNGRRVSTVAEFDEALAAARRAGAAVVALLVEREGVRAWMPVRVGAPP